MIMKRCFLWLILLAFVFSIGSISVLAQDDLAVTKGCHSIDGTGSLLGDRQLTDNAGAVFVYETTSQTVMYQWESDKKLHPASMVKIMTALLVLENGTLSDTVTVTGSAVQSLPRDAVSVELQAGEQITVDDLMYCMLVYSANDAAAVLAEYIAGSQDAFVAMMNARGAELGCTGTVFTNVHGLHDNEQIMTARDLCRILSAALEHKEFRTYFGTVNYKVPATNLHKERNLSSNNYLMNKASVAIYLDNRVTGGRTGITSEGNRNIVSLSQSGNMEIVCIVMDSASTLTEYGRTEKYGGFPETIALLDQVYSGYARRQIIFPNQTLRQLPVLNGDNDLFVTSYQGFSTVLPGNMALDQLSFTYEEPAGGIQAPVEKGQPVGSLQVWNGAICVAETEIYAMNDVAAAYDKLSDLQPVKQGFAWGAILLVVILLLAGGFGAYLLFARLRAKKLAAARMRSRRR